MTELPLTLTRTGQTTLARQIEDQLRARIRAGSLRPGVLLPSSRDLATQLGVSRSVVSSAYEQLNAEGYVELRPRARPRVPEQADGPAAPSAPAAFAGAAGYRFDFGPSQPDVSGFPRTAWLRCMREVIGGLSDEDAGAMESQGTERLRAVVAEHAGRVRGVIATPDRVLITNGYTQSVGLLCRALVAAGATAIAFEAPSDPHQHTIARQTGLALQLVPTDHDGLRVDALHELDVAALVTTPAHQYPTGSVLSGERRRALVEWAARTNTFLLEDDYDAEYRYDRTPPGALQGLAPERVIYAGSVSKTLAPALRLGWLVLPESLVEPLTTQKALDDRATARIDQLALARLIERGDLDRHLRRMRQRYRERRVALLDALAEQLPAARVTGIAAGLHAAVTVPETNEQRLLAEARERRINLAGLTEFGMPPTGDATLLIGYARTPPETIAAGIAVLAEAVRAAAGSRARTGTVPVRAPL